MVDRNKGRRKSVWDEFRKIITIKVNVIDSSF